MFDPHFKSLVLSLSCICLLLGSQGCDRGGRCTPSCSLGCGASDGCGGQCGCGQGYQCNSAGQCVAPGECFETCGVAGWECGELCEKSCGVCPHGAACNLGTCSTCTPRCTACGTGDGCGGVCGCGPTEVCSPEGTCVAEQSCDETCESKGWACGSICGEECGTCGSSSVCHEGACFAETPNSCPSCSLQVAVLEQTMGATGLSRVVIAVDFAPAEDQPLPRMMDIRFSTSPSAQLLSVQEGEAMGEASKRLFLDSSTGRNWRVRPDGTTQVLVLSTTNTTRIGAGRLLTLTFNVAGGNAAFALVRRPQVFAPPSADSALQHTAYSDPAVVVQ